MGLASGDRGVKALIKTRFREAARTYTTLGDVRHAVGVERAGVATVLDGNVLMMQVPSDGDFGCLHRRGHQRRAARHGERRTRRRRL